MKTLRLTVGLLLISFALLVAGTLAQSPRQQRKQDRQTDLQKQKNDSSMTMESEQALPFALVELFTSEGCSSCPSADRHLEQITENAEASGRNVYTLSYHVDYWDYLGWKDPYSAKKFSDRQREYASKFGSSRIYTPQMVVNGQVEFVGSNRNLSDRALDAALQSKTAASIEVEPVVRGRVIEVTWHANGIDSGDVIQVALVQNEGSQKVNRGENARRQLTHVNIVRQLQTVRQPQDKGQTELSVPSGFQKTGFHVVAFVQSDSAIKAVSRSSF